MQFDRIVFHIPVIGALVRKVVVARFSHTLATLVESGVPMLHSLSLLEGVVENKVIGSVIKDVRTSVEAGDRIAPTLKESNEFPVDAVQMISVGEETGKLGNMLNKIADYYDVSIEYSVKKLTTLIEPIFIIIMGGVVGLIMAAMLLPIFDMVKTIQR